VFLHFKVFSFSVGFFRVWRAFCCFFLFLDGLFCGVFRVYASFYEILISSFLLVLEKTSSEALSPSPDSPEASGGNPFWAGVRPEKIGADSGKKLLIKFQFLKFQNRTGFDSAQPDMLVIHYYICNRNKLIIKYKKPNLKRGFNSAQPDMLYLYIIYADKNKTRWLL